MRGVISFDYRSGEFWVFVILVLLTNIPLIKGVISKYVEEKIDNDFKEKASIYFAEKFSDAEFLAEVAKKAGRAAEKKASKPYRNPLEDEE